MAKNVIVLYKEVVRDYELVERRIIVYGDSGESLRDFKEMCENERKEISAEEGWVIDELLGIVSNIHSDVSFQAYRDGWAAQDHTYIELTETEIV